MKNLHFFCKLSVLILFFSCTQDNPTEPTPTLSYEIQIRSSGLDALSFQMAEFWDYAFDTYTMEVVCGCTCEDMLVIPDIWNNGKHLLPSCINDITLESENCEVLQNAYKFTCNYTTIGQAEADLRSLIAEKAYLSSDEKELINKLFRSISIK